MKKNKNAAFVLPSAAGLLLARAAQALRDAGQPECAVVVDAAILWPFLGDNGRSKLHGSAQMAISRTGRMSTRSPEMTCTRKLLTHAASSSFPLDAAIVIVQSGLMATHRRGSARFGSLPSSKRRQLVLNLQLAISKHLDAYAEEHVNQDSVLPSRERVREALCAVGLPGALMLKNEEQSSLRHARRKRANQRKALADK